MRIFYGGVGVEYDHRTILKVLGVLPGSNLVVSRLTQARLGVSSEAEIVFPCTLRDLTDSELGPGLEEVEFEVLVDIEGDSSYVFPRGALMRDDVGSATAVRSLPSDQTLTALKVLGTPQVIVGATFQDLPDLTKMTRYFAEVEEGRLVRIETKARSTFERCLKVINTVPKGSSGESEESDESV